MQAKITRKNIEFLFEITNPNDTIQRCHSRGFFYEEDELIDLRLVIPGGAIILDIGANIGNHTLYFAHLLPSEKVIPIECNPAALDILIKNINNNPSRKIDTNYLGFALGVSDDFCEMGLSDHLADNLGATSIKSVGSTGSIKMKSGDDLLRDLSRIDFIKIDVEGYEFKVLEGIEKLIQKCRPVIYIEVANPHINKLKDWLQISDYRIERTHIRHRGLANYLCMPWR